MRKRGTFPGKKRLPRAAAKKLATRSGKTPAVRSRRPITNKRTGTLLASVEIATNSNLNLENECEPDAVSKL
ncbi:MAG: hypothetical protein SH847_22840 [Roseiflexaceae bacterium]|nr:hypothetical protein [Roseiflexaceae bacterium]